MLKFANISGFNAREDYWRDKEIHWNERASLTGGSCSISSEFAANERCRQAHCAHLARMVARRDPLIYVKG
jgi:hypothetical protein